MELSFGHKAFILSMSKLIINSKTSFAIVVHYVMLFENVSEKVKVKQDFICSPSSHVVSAKAFSHFSQAYLKDI